jgi:hypothetical protein
MVLRLAGKVTEVSSMQPLNAKSPMVVTPSGIVMWVTVFWYGLTMSWVMTLVSAEKVKWMLLFIAVGIQCSDFYMP